MRHGPAYVSFSGGRTSAFMLRREIDRGVGPDVHVLFANTGKEREETLEFIRAVERAWSVPIVWVERPPGGGFREVTFETASRRGEPFDALIDERGYLPHPGAPYCSTELKARVAGDWMRARGYDEWDALVGLRFDETRRHSIAGRKIEGGLVELPLVRDRIHGGDVDAFWHAQPFDLRLHPHEGNCDLCWKKKASKVAGLIDQDPDRAIWWSDAERRTKTRWRNNRPTYTAMFNASRAQLRLPILNDDLDEGEPCGFCAA